MRMMLLTILGLLLAGISYLAYELELKDGLAELAQNEELVAKTRAESDSTQAPARALQTRQGDAEQSDETSTDSAAAGTAAADSTAESDTAEQTAATDADSSAVAATEAEPSTVAAPEAESSAAAETEADTSAVAATEAEPSTVAAPEAESSAAAETEAESSTVATTEAESSAAVAAPEAESSTVATTEAESSTVTAPEEEVATATVASEPAPASGTGSSETASSSQTESDSSGEIEVAARGDETQTAASSAEEQVSAQPSQPVRDQASDRGQDEAVSPAGGTEPVAAASGDAGQETETAAAAGDQATTEDADPEASGPRAVLVKPGQSVRDALPPRDAADESTVATGETREAVASKPQPAPDTATAAAPEAAPQSDDADEIEEADSASSDQSGEQESEAPLTALTSRLEKAVESLFSSDEDSDATAPAGATETAESSDGPDSSAGASGTEQAIAPLAALAPTDQEDRDTAPSTDTASTAGADDGSPSFDVVTVDPDGTAVLAGRAEPGAEVTVQAGDKVVGTAIASDRGEWVVIPDNPLESGSSALSLKAVQPDGGEEKVSDQVVTVILPGDETPATVAESSASGEQQIAAVAPPRSKPVQTTDQVSEADRSDEITTEPSTAEDSTAISTAPASDTATASSARGSEVETADTAKSDAPEDRSTVVTSVNPPQDAARLVSTPPPLITPPALSASEEIATTPPSVGISTPTDGESEVAVAAATTEQSTAAQPAGSDDGDGTETVLSRRATTVLSRKEGGQPDAEPQPLVTVPAAEGAEQLASSAPVIEPAPDAPAGPVVVLSERGQPSRALQLPGATDTTDGPNAPITFDSVDYDDEGQIIVAGRVKAGTNVRAYINNQLLGDTVADSGGKWALRATRNIDPGAYELRVDQIDEQGIVLARVAAPFERAEPSVVALAKARGEVIIQPGDNLWNIARDLYGSGPQYTVIYNANTNQIRDPALIYPGQVLRTPGAMPSERVTDSSSAG